MELADELEQLRNTVRAYINVGYPGEDAECRFDHNGRCQAHNMEQNCSFGAMRKLVTLPGYGAAPSPATATAEGEEV